MVVLSFYVRSGMPPPPSVSPSNHHLVYSGQLKSVRLSSLTHGSAASAVHNFCRLEDRRIHEARRRVLKYACKPRQFVPTTSG